MYVILFMWHCLGFKVLQIGVLRHYEACHNYVLTRLIHGRDPCVFVCWKCLDLVHVKFYRHYILETICLDCEHRHEKFNLRSINTTHHAIKTKIYNNWKQYGILKFFAYMNPHPKKSQNNLGSWFFFQFCELNGLMNIHKVT